MTTTAQSARAARRRRRQTEMVVVNAASAAAAQHFKRMATAGGRTAGTSHRLRVRLSVHDVYLALGPIYFRRAYRMDYHSFLHLHDKLKDNMEAARKNMTTYVSNGGRQGGRYKLPPIPNGAVPAKTRLACAIRYFSGGSPYDIMTVYGVSHTIVFDSVWQVVEATNNLEEFKILYPECHRMQESIARGFAAVSDVPFTNCAGAVDGVVIWTNRPTESDTLVARLGDGKFYCGRKKKYGLNCQVVSDANGRILDISITHGAATSDIIAFESSSLFARLEEGGVLKEGLTLFGDNAYLNTNYMASPYPNANGTRDAYNFYQSQVRIRVECCFGMLAMRWGILSMAIPQNTSMVKVIGMVNALAKLHNFCLNESNLGTMRAEMEMYHDANRLRRDVVYMQGVGCIAMSSTNEHAGVDIPTDLTDIGNDPDDVPRSVVRQDVTRNFNQRLEINERGDFLPRRLLHDMVIAQGLRRPAANVRQHNSD